MTDLAPAATETVAPAIPAPRGSAGSAWLKWLARRIGLAILTLWLCSALVFFATAALGDPVRRSSARTTRPARSERRRSPRRSTSTSR